MALLFFDGFDHLGDSGQPGTLGSGLAGGVYGVVVY